MPISRIKTDGIQDDAVTSAKIGTSVIVADDLAANSVTVSEIQDGAVTSAKLDTNIDIAGTLDVTGATTLDDGLTVDNDGATVLTVDRATSDGTIIDLQKDGSSVGSIGIDGAYLTFNNGAVKIGDTANGQLLLLTATETGTPRLAPVADNAVNIGNTTTRFKDLYLSGGVYVGGTTSANYLDDYEEGTFTPAFSVEGGGTISASTTYRGDYTKIGRKVHIRIHAKWDDYTDAGGNSNGAFILRNLPFQYVSANGGGEGLLARGLYWSSNNDNNNQWSNELVLHTFYNSSGSDGAYMKWLDSKDSSGGYLRQNNPLNNSSGNFIIEGEFTYITNA
jgi:hypothetical protein